MGWSAADLTGSLLRRERPIVLGSVALLTLLGWSYIVSGAGMQGSMRGMHPPLLATLVLMWWLMMVAMMLPSAAPAILLYARVRRARGGATALAQPWIFLAGYLALWLLFSIVAATVQLLVARQSMAFENRYAEAAVLASAGIYQFSPLKQACLASCRSPAQFLTRHWRAGWTGALRMGVLHGTHCVGCCWLLMALLFVGGVMNLVWIVALTLVVTIEKLMRRGEWFARATGFGLLAWGIIKASGY